MRGKTASEKFKGKTEKSRLFSENIEEKIEILKSEYIELLNEQAGAQK